MDVCREGILRVRVRERGGQQYVSCWKISSGYQSTEPTMFRYNPADDLRACGRGGVWHKGRWKTCAGMVSSSDAKSEERVVP